MSDSVFNNSSKLNELAEARLNLHYACQLPAAFGDQLAAPEPDFSHTSLNYSYADGSLNSVSIGDTFVGIELETLLLYIGSVAKKTRIGQKDIKGMNLEEAYDWLSKELKDKAGLDNSGLVFPKYPDFPTHPIKEGTAFSENIEDELKTFHYFYRESFFCLQNLLKDRQKELPIRIWPHHFDMAVLFNFRDEGFLKDASVGVGFSPGDSHYNEPYWYVSPWPYPQNFEPPGISSPAFWHEEGFISAILRSSQLVTGEQTTVVEAFLNEALERCKELVKK